MTILPNKKSRRKEKPHSRNVDQYGDHGSHLHPPVALPGPSHATVTGGRSDGCAKRHSSETGYINYHKKKKNNLTSQCKSTEAGASPHLRSQSGLSSGSLSNPVPSSRRNTPDREVIGPHASGRLVSNGEELIISRKLPEASKDCSLESGSVGGRLRRSASPRRCNSDDEHEMERQAVAGGAAGMRPLYTEEMERKFEEALLLRGLTIKSTEEDGACLFRSVADQVYGDQDMHSVVRQLTMDYVQKNADYFSQYITEDIQEYVDRKRKDHTYGNHVEMQAIAEIYNRSIHVYEYSAEPMNVFHGSHATDNVPIRVSYHAGNHYNSVVDPFAATIGVGLGLPGLYPGLAEKNLMRDASKVSEQEDIEKTMLEDKLAASDWEATDRSLQQQILQQSYIDFLAEQRGVLPGASGNRSPQPSTSNQHCATSGGSAGTNSSSTVYRLPRCSLPRGEPFISANSMAPVVSFTESPKSSPCLPTPIRTVADGSKRTRGSVNAKSNHIQSSNLVTECEKMDNIELGLADFETEDDILQRILQLSQQEYFSSFKRSAAACFNSATAGSGKNSVEESGLERDTRDGFTALGRNGDSGRKSLSPNLRYRESDSEVCEAGPAVGHDDSRLEEVTKSGNCDLLSESTCPPTDNDAHS